MPATNMQQPEKAEIMDKSKDIILAAVRSNLLKLDAGGAYAGKGRSFGVEGPKKGVFVFENEDKNKGKRKEPEELSQALPLAAQVLPKKARKAQAVKMSCVCGDKEATGFLLRCRRCSNCQHGNCVGIIAQTPESENFYCSSCSGTALSAVVDEQETTSLLSDTDSDLLSERRGSRSSLSLESDLDDGPFGPGSDYEECLDFSTPLSSRPPSVTGSVNNDKSAAPTPRACPSTPKVTERVCFVNPATGQMLTGNRAPRRPETIKKYLAEGWVPLDSPRKKRPVPVPGGPTRPGRSLLDALDIDGQGSQPHSPPKARLVDEISSSHSTPRSTNKPPPEWPGRALLGEDGSRTFFHSFNYDGIRFSVGDCVYLQPNNPGEPLHIAKINAVWETAGRNQMSVQWFFRREETAFGRAASQDRREIFASDAGDVCPVEALAGRCEVKHSDDVEDWNTYRKADHAYFFRQSYNPSTRMFDSVDAPLQPVRRWGPPSALGARSPPATVPPSPLLVPYQEPATTLLPAPLGRGALDGSPGEALFAASALGPGAGEHLLGEHLFCHVPVHCDDAADVLEAADAFDIGVFLNFNDCMAC